MTTTDGTTHVEHARIYTLPDEPPPMYVSGFGPKATELAARIGDGYITTRATRSSSAASGSDRRQARRRPASRSCYADTDDEGVEHAHRLWANSGLPGELAQVLPSPKHFEQASELVTEERPRESVVAGNDVEDAPGAAPQEYADAGYDEVYVANMGPHHQQIFEFYGREVLPRLG